LLIPKKIKKILFIRLTALGDIALTFPAVKFLRQQFPENFFG